MGIKGINNKPFIDLTTYIDLSVFDKIQPEILRGFVLARDIAQVGNLNIDPNWLHLDGTYTPLILAYEKFKKLDDYDPFKKAGQNLTTDQLATYLKFAFGGYDLYVTYHKHLLKEYFKSLDDWINQLNIFDEIDDTFIMTIDGGGITFEHHHPPVDINDIDKPSEFIHIRPNLIRPMYVRDSDTMEKYYVNARVAYWNDQDRHGGDPTYTPTYAIRIDGKFTKKFKEKIYNTN
jgi:hypothetical protein